MVYLGKAKGVAMNALNSKLSRLNLIARWLTIFQPFHYPNRIPLLRLVQQQ
jgi:hypothetical protein